MPVFTNGTLIDESCRPLFASGRVIPVFSIEGDAGSTNARRGEGIHETVLEKAALMREWGLPFGFSITLTSRNADLALSRGFLDGIEELGASALFLVEYVPIQAGSEGLVVTASQRAALRELGSMKTLRFPVIRLPGRGGSEGACLAAGKGFIHLSHNGRVEACPFAPFSDRDAASASLALALRSPLMRTIREARALRRGIQGGCALCRQESFAASPAQDLRPRPIR
jgi:MoaA/NifB/PqqE/SkfB family radical SAM enzyme